MSTCIQYENDKTSLGSQSCSKFASHELLTCWPNLVTTYGLYNCISKHTNRVTHIASKNKLPNGVHIMAMPFFSCAVHTVASR